jgi:hypothetical protein
MLKAPIICTLLVAAAAACSSSDDAVTPEAADEVEIIPFTSTKMLDGGDVASLAPETEPGVLRFTPAPARLADVQVGSILVSGLTPQTPRGLLRAVVDVAREGDALVLRTQEAPLQLAFRKVHVKSKQRSTGAIGDMPFVDKGVTPQSLKPQADPSLTVSKKKELEMVLFDGDGDSGTTNDQVVATGALTGTMTFTFGIDVDWGDILDLPGAVKDCIASLAKIAIGERPSCAVQDLLPEAKLRFDVVPRIDADANLHGAAVLEYEKEFDIARADLPPIPLGPLVIFPTVDVTGKVEGAASAGFEVSAHGFAEFETGVTLSSRSQTPDFMPPRLRDKGFSAEPPKVSLFARGKVGVGARLNLLIYSVAGPYAEARAYAEVTANPDDQPCWKVGVGLEGNLGVKVEPRLPVLGGVTLFRWNSPVFSPIQIPILSGTCPVPPEGPPRPPGSGPDARTLGKPTFQPWSRLYEAAAETAPAVAPYGLERTDLVRTIDGRYLVTGDGANTLIKVDEGGQVVWGSRYAVEDTWKFRYVRAASTHDGGVMVAAVADGNEPLSLLKITQAGDIVFHRGFDVTDDVCANLEVHGMTRDEGRGFYVYSRCRPGTAMVLHVDEAANVLDVRRIEGAQVGLDPSLLVASATDLAVGGRTIDPAGEKMFVARLGAGTTANAMQYGGCTDAPYLIPTVGRLGSDGDLTVAGNASGARYGFVTRVRRDGSVGFGRITGLGPGLSQVAAYQSVLELPTTGFIAVGSTQSYLAAAGTPDATPAVFITGLDSGGRPLWAKRLSLRGTSGYRAAGLAGLWLTDDGGALISALAADDGASTGMMWASKVFAKDGSVDFDPAKGESASLPIQEIDCAVTGAPLEVRVVPLTLATHPVASRGSRVAVASGLVSR